MKQLHYECNFCFKKFLYEGKFLNHKCKQMERSHILGTPIGQAGWSFYQRWLKSQNKTVPVAETFLSSKYFNTFIRFAEFVKTVKLVNIDAFFRLMKQHDYPPALWTNEQVYSTYLNYLENEVPPEEQVKTTIQYLYKLADGADCDVSNIFSELGVNTTISLLQQRKLSPWVVLFCKSFKVLIANAEPQQKIMVQTVIKPEYWQTQFIKHPQTVEKVKKYVNQMNM